MLPLVEKYRPKSIDEVVGHDAIKKSFRHYIEKESFNSILLHGPPGTGKTALLLAFLREFYGDSFRDNVTEYNASDDRGIDFIRNTVKKWANISPKGGYSYRTLYLGECDALTPAAQDALKRILEITASNVRFVADCNDLSALIPAIRSRFVRMYVGPHDGNQIVEHLGFIADEEDLNFGNVTLGTIAEYATSLRDAIQTLESLPPGADDFHLAEIDPHPTPQSVVKLIRSNFEQSWNDRERVLQECLKESGNRAHEVLEMIYEMFSKKDHAKKGEILYTIGEWHYKMERGGNPIIGLRCCLDVIKEIVKGNGNK